MIWPKKRIKTVSERTKELATHPCRANASKSCVKIVRKLKITYWVPQQDEPMLSAVMPLLNVQVSYMARSIKGGIGRI